MKTPTRAEFRRQPLDLQSIELFMPHPWIAKLELQYEHDAILANYAVRQIIEDLNAYNKNYNQERNRVAFTTIEGRVKDKASFFRKLLKSCVENSKGITEQIVAGRYSQIKDLCGVRFSCPYFDEVLPAVGDLRAYFKGLGYVTELQTKPQYRDRNELEKGDELGYRSYHFLVKVPTPVDIYGKVELRLCEVQARTELQHVWAVKSHNLLYKSEGGWNFSDSHVVSDMKQLSNSLRAADESLVSIRDRIVK
jgi:ppGpp synthetase/RelA/SpoT-type nucleotidyltranferase